MVVVLTNPDHGDILVEVAADGETFLGLLPQELVDDAIGANSTAQQRLDWAVKCSAEIKTAVIAKHKGGFIRAPFDRVLPKGVK